MRDPEQVKRAERAATALERSWLHWRARHGLGTGQLPPVSSYVGYSVEEPWGQPRVVFGLEAEEAERLAAILDGQDYVGPVHAQVAWPDRRRQESPGSPWSLNGPGADVPAQAADPDAGRPGASGRAGAAQVAAAPPQRPTELDVGGRAGAAQFAAAPLERPSAAPDDLTAEQPVLPTALRQAAAMADLPAELSEDAAARLQDLTARPSGRPGLVAVRPRPAIPPEPPPAEPPAQPESIVPAAAASPGPADSSGPVDSAGPVDSSGLAGSAGPADPAGSAGPVDSSGLAGSAGPAGLAGPAGPAGPADSSAPAGSSGPAECEEPGAATEPGAPAAVPRYGGTGSAEPVTRQFGEPAPWWQGTPFEQTAARVAEAASVQAEDQVAMARLFPVSRLNRARKPPPGAPQRGPWPAAGGKAAAGAD